MRGQHPLGGGRADHVGVQHRVEAEPVHQGREPLDLVGGRLGAGHVGEHDVGRAAGACRDLVRQVPQLGPDPGQRGEIDEDGDLIAPRLVQRQQFGEQRHGLPDAVGRGGIPRVVEPVEPHPDAVGDPVQHRAHREAHQLGLAVEVVAQRADVQLGLVRDRAQGDPRQPVAHRDAEQRLDDLLPPGDRIHFPGHPTVLSQL